MSSFDAQRAPEVGFNPATASRPEPIRIIESRSPSAGMNLSDSIYDRLLRDRIIVLGQVVDDDIANRL
ncbi:MAG: hypothetical protein ACR2N4_13645, partial [Jatrophihabitans sp.]